MNKGEVELYCALTIDNLEKYNRLYGLTDAPLCSIDGALILLNKAFENNDIEFAKSIVNEVIFLLKGAHSCLKEAYEVLGDFHKESGIPKREEIRNLAANKVSLDEGRGKAPNPLGGRS